MSTRWPPGIKSTAIPRTGCRFLDVNMPALNGFETLRGMMQLPGRAGYKVIMYSNGMTEEASAKALLLGADYSIRKTDTVNALSAILQDVLAGIGEQAPV